MHESRRDTRAGGSALPARWIILLCALLGVGLMVATRPGSTRLPAMSSHVTAHPAITGPHGAPPRGRDGLPNLQSGRGRPAALSSGPTAASAARSTAQVVAASAPNTTVPAPAGPATPTTTPSTPSPSVVPSSASRTTDVVQQGWLQGPTWTSAVYESQGANPRSIVARWTSGARLTLTTTCVGGTQQVVATAVATIAVAAGSCTVTLAGDASTPVTTYSIDLGAS
jgi:hypothetical protein